MNYNEKSSYVDVNECTSRGACSISPTISSLSELAMTFLKQIAFYVLKLEKLGGSNDNIKQEIVKVLASLVSVNEFSEEQLFKIVKNEYGILQNTITTYNNRCNKSSFKFEDIGFNSNTTLSQAISIGEKIFLTNYNLHTTEIKNLSSILEIVMKSLSLNLIKLADFNNFDTSICDEIIKALNIFNSKRLSGSRISNVITKLSTLDYRVQLKISKLLLKSFGGVSKVTLSHSTRKGKAILVSGNNFFDLLKILEETKDMDVDIYTHSNLLITHALKTFHQFKHLQGHYGGLTDNCILDFATFPGAILITKNSKSNTEYLYRGQLFSTDYIVPKGVIQIQNNDYSQLIETAKASKGFAKGKTKPDSELGYKEKELNLKLDEIASKLTNNEIKRLYIVGIDALRQSQSEYFREFFDKLKDDEFAISFAYNSRRENVLTIPIGNYIPLAMKILKKLFSNFSISDKKIFFMFTTCDVMTISGIITLKNLGCKNIYMAKCLPTLINPSVFETFSKKYSIKTTTSPKKDLQAIRAK
jgi:hydroxylamine reductase